MLFAFCFPPKSLNVHKKRYEKQFSSYPYCRLSRRLDPNALDDAVEIASLPDQVRGYEDLKLRRAAAYRAELTLRMP